MSQTPPAPVARMSDNDFEQLAEDIVEICVNQGLGEISEDFVADARRAREADDENEDLHLVAQGIKHYWRCKNNVASENPDVDECLRCRADRAEADLRECVEKAATILGTDAAYTDGGQNNGVVLAALGWLEKQKAEAEADAARLRELLARAEPWVGLSVEAVEDDPKTGEGYQTEEYALVDKLRDEIAAALKGGE